MALLEPVDLCSEEVSMGVPPWLLFSEAKKNKHDSRIFPVIYWGEG